ncbi:hypothetical protein GCM10028805_47430 [Spirosoma harenae]
MKTPIEALTAWLDRPIYTDGVRLYEQLIGADFYLTLFKTGIDDHNREWLRSALEKKLAELQQAELERKASYPDSLVGELAQAGKLMDERIILKQKMRDLYLSGIRESAELKVMAFRVLTIKDLLDQIYGRRTFFDTHHFLPEAASVPEADSPTLLLRRRNNLRTYVTKYSAELEGPLDPGRRRKLGRKLTQFKSELHDLDNQLQHLSL